MLVPNQKVKLKWNNRYRKYYESIKDENGNQKYFWTRKGNEFEVDPEDLPRGSSKLVKVQCDYGGEIIEKAYNNLIKERESSSIVKDCCKDCQPLKMREIYGTLDEIEIIEDEQNSTVINYSKEYLISEFFRYVDEFGIYPKKTDIDSADGYPSAFCYAKWGSWTNFLKEINIIGDYGWYKKDEEMIKEMYPNEENSISDINDKLIVKRSIYELQKQIKKMGLKERNLFTIRDYDKNIPFVELFYISLHDLYEDIGKCPTAMDYDRYATLNEIPSRKRTEKALGKTFAQVCKEIFSETNKDMKSNEELLTELRLLKRKLGRTPKANELQLYGLSEKKTYTRRFEMTYQELIESLGWEQASPRLTFKSDEELLADYERLFNELGRLPNHSDLDDCEYTSSSSTYKVHFESFNNIWNILDLDYEINQDISAGTVCLNKNNEICRSNAELQISNLLIDNGIQYIPEKHYSDFDIDLLNKWRMDWYLSDYDIYVEFFGLYQETQLKRKTRIGKYSRKVKKKIDYCLNNNIILVDLYKKDLENGYKGLINKFNNVGIRIIV